MIDRRFINVVHISLLFLFLYSSEQTVGSLQKLIQKSISDENTDYSFDGYAASAISYLSFAFFIPITPILASILGVRLCILVGALIAATYSLLLIVSKEWLTYALLITSGFGDSIIWMAEYSYIVQNAHESTLMSDVGFFWGIYSLSLLLGSIFTAVEFQGISDIDSSIRYNLFYLLGSFALLAAISGAFLGKPQGSLSNRIGHLGPVETAKKMFSIARSQKMGILIVAILYNGFQQAFATYVYPPTIAFTKLLGSISTFLDPISSICYSSGICLSGFTTMSLSRRQIKNYTYGFGYILLLIAYIGIFLNHPNNASYGPTLESSYLSPKIWVTIVCSLLLGLGEGFHTTQIYTIVGELNPDNSAECGSCCEFFKGLGGGLFLIACIWIGLYTQLLILIIFGMLSTAAFIWVDRKMKEK